MIINRQHFDLNGYCVFEKLTICLPFTYQASFSNEACLLYFRGPDVILHSATETVHSTVAESLLLQCGNYLAQFTKSAQGETCEVYAIHLHAPLLIELFKYSPPQFILDADRSFISKPASQEAIDNFMDQLSFYFEHPELVSNEFILVKLKELVLLLAQSSASGTLNLLFTRLFRHRQVKLSALIETHLYSPLSVDELAGLAGLSTSSFKREFRTVYNDSPANYLRTQRLQKAAHLLVHSDYNVAEICFQTGFGDTSHFIRAFKKMTGDTPLAYRNRHQDERTGMT